MPRTKTNPEQEITKTVAKKAAKTTRKATAKSTASDLPPAAPEQLGLPSVLEDLEESPTIIDKATNIAIHQSSNNSYELNGDYSNASLKSVTMLMKYPFFPARSYKTTKRYQISQTNDKGQLEKISVELRPDQTLGGPSINDGDVLKFCLSAFRDEVVKNTIKEGAPTSLSFSARDFYKFTKRESIGGSQQKSLEQALERLMSVRVVFSSVIEEKNTSQIIKRDILKNTNFISEWSREATEETDKYTNDRVKKLRFKVTFPSWMSEIFMNSDKILTLERKGFFYLNAIEKTIYEKLRSYLGHQAYYKVRLFKLAEKLGRTIVEKVDGTEKPLPKEVNRFRTEVYNLMADDLLLGISLAIEPPSKNADEMVIVFPSDWKNKLSDQTDPLTKTPLSRLELAIYQKEGLAALRQFQGKTYKGRKGFWHSETVRKKFESKKNNPWKARHEADMDILKRGDHHRRLSGEEELRYKLLNACRRMQGASSYLNDASSIEDVDFIEFPQDEKA